MSDNSISFGIANIDESRRLIFGVVYTPNKIDAFGWYMEPKEVEKMAHRYMQLSNLNKSIDTQHDNKSNGSYPVQSFIAREGDPDYPAGSWVLGVKITRDDIWQQIIDGEINAFSMEIYVKKVPAEVKYEVVSKQVGITEPAEDGHSHYFYAEMDDNGRVIRGKTSVSAGHYHEIDLNSVTEFSDNHLHRYFIGQ